MRKRRGPDVLSDTEVLELLRGEPELLAIADAVHATLGDGRPLRGRHRRAARLALAAVVGLIAVALALAGPWGDEGGGLVERALAAVGTRGPVVHAVLRTRVPDQVLVDLSSGGTTAETTELELWFDEQRGLLHTVIRRQGQVVGDMLATPAGTVSAAGRVLEKQGLRPMLDRALVAFTTDYRDALRQRRAQPVESVAGFPAGVKLLEIPTRFGFREQVAIDPETFRPLIIRPLRSDGRSTGVESTVVRMESMLTAQANFTRPEPLPLGPSAGSVVDSDPIPVGEAQSLLARSPLWAGPAISGIALTEVKRERLSRSIPSRKRRTFGSGLALLYGDVRNGLPDWGGRFLLVRQAARPEAAYGFLTGSLRLEPLPPPGSVRLARRPLAGTAGGALWSAQLRSGGVYVTLTGSSRALVLAAARALRPIPTKLR